MKITKTQLRRIIKEEILKEGKFTQYSTGIEDLLREEIRKAIKKKYKITIEGKLMNVILSEEYNQFISELKVIRSSVVKEFKSTVLHPMDELTPAEIKVFKKWFPPKEVNPKWDSIQIQTNDIDIILDKEQSARSRGFNYRYELVITDPKEWEDVFYKKTKNIDMAATDSVKMKELESLLKLGSKIADFKKLKYK